MTTAQKGNGQRRPGTLLTTALLALLFTAPALLSAPTFAKGGKAPNPDNGHGKITAVSATSITVTPKNGPAKTYTIDASTKVTLDGKPAKAADLNTTERAQVKSKDGVTAKKIKARTKGYKKAKGGGKGNPIAPGPL